MDPSHAYVARWSKTNLLDNVKDKLSLAIALSNQMILIDRYHHSGKLLYWVAELFLWAEYNDLCIQSHVVYQKFKTYLLQSKFPVNTPAEVGRELKNLVMGNVLYFYYLEVVESGRFRLRYNIEKTPW